MISYQIRFETLDVPFPVEEISWQGFDIDSHGNWLAVREEASGLRLAGAWGEVALQVKRPYALVRWLGDMALIVHARIRKAGEVNAWIVDPKDGRMLSGFSVGDGVEDVVVLRDFIVVSYFDEGVLGGIGPAREGVAVFDRQGAYLWGYHGAIRDSVGLVSCYAMCPTGPNAVALCGYMGFELVELNVGQQSQVVRATPPKLHGCSAITFLKETAFFRGPYPRKGEGEHVRDEVYAFKATGHYDRFGYLPGPTARGLVNGRMLTIGEHGVRVASFAEW